jgi:type II secretory pathway component PulJ
VRLPRIRFTLREMMIAVAMSPIVLVSGWKARDFWPISSSVIEQNPMITSLHADTWTMNVVVQQEFSLWPSIIAMAATTAMLATFWVIVARCQKQT